MPRKRVYNEVHILSQLPYVQYIDIHEQIYPEQFVIRIYLKSGLEFLIEFSNYYPFTPPNIIKTRDSQYYLRSQNQIPKKICPNPNPYEFCNCIHTPNKWNVTFTIKHILEEWKAHDLQIIKIFKQHLARKLPLPLQSLNNISMYI